MQKDMLVFWVLYLLTLLIFLSKPMVVGWDPSEYLAYGKWLYSGYGFDAGYRPPVWPVILGALWKIGLPMPLTMVTLAFLIYAAIPLFPLAVFKDSRKYIGLVIFSHPIFFNYSHLPLSHIIASLFFVMAYSAKGARAGIYAALAGLSRFTYFLSIPFLCWDDLKKWKGAVISLVIYFSITTFIYGNPFEQMISASEIINYSNFISFWEKEPSFYVGLILVSPLLLLGIFSKSRFNLGFFSSLLYFTRLAHKEARFFIDQSVYLSASLVERYRHVPLLLVAMNLLFLPFSYGFSKLPVEAFEVIPDGASVAGMTPEINAYKDVYFTPVFGPPWSLDFDEEYCIYFKWSYPCYSDFCDNQTQAFKDMCEPIYRDENLIVGKIIPHPSAEPG